MKTKNQFPLCNHLKSENKKHAINSLFHTIAEQSGKQFAQYVYSFELCTLHGQKIILLRLIAITSNLHCQKFTLYTLLQQPCLYSLRFYTIASLSACAIITVLYSVHCTVHTVVLLFAAAVSEMALLLLFSQLIGRPPASPLCHPLWPESQDDLPSWCMFSRYE